MYCGDGINDLAALAAADVGMAIGSSDASAVAPISDRHTSPAGRLCICIAHAFKLRNAMLVQAQERGEKNNALQNAVCNVDAAHTLF